MQFYVTKIFSKRFFGKIYLNQSCLMHNQHIIHYTYSESEKDTHILYETYRIIHCLKKNRNNRYYNKWISIKHIITRIRNTYYNPNTTDTNYNSILQYWFHEINIRIFLKSCFHQQFIDNSIKLRLLLDSWNEDELNI